MREWKFNLTAVFRVELLGDEYYWISVISAKPHD